MRSKALLIASFFLVAAGCGRSIVGYHVDAAPPPEDSSGGDGAAGADGGGEGGVPCGAGLLACGGACVDPGQDPANCGACGTACAAGQVCDVGECATSCSAG